MIISSVFPRIVKLAGHKASRRHPRNRQLSVEAMEERLALSSAASLTSLKVINSANPGGAALIINGNNPPGVQQGGDVACATFTLTAGNTGPVRVGLADYSSPTYLYTTPYGTYTNAQQRNWLNHQVYYDSSSAILDSMHPTATLYVNLSKGVPGQCFNQVNAFVYSSPCAPDNYGGLVTKFSTSDYYGFDSPDAPGTGTNRSLSGAVLNCTPSTGPNCCQTSDYYEDHPSALPAFEAIGNRVYSRAQLSALLDSSAFSGGPTLIGAQQLITAYANLADGCGLTSCASDAIRRSNLILDDLPILTTTDSHGRISYNTNASLSWFSSDGVNLFIDSLVLCDFNSC